MSEPEWLTVLRDACTSSPTQPDASQKKMANRLGVSPAMINQVLRGAYKGSTARLEARVRGELMRQTLVCPALGEINTKRCQDEQRRPFAPTNPQRVAVFKACRAGCPFSKITGG